MATIEPDGSFRELNKQFSELVGYSESAPVPHHHSEALRLQTYNSMRAVDFLLSLGMVDEKRLGVTGESGGGTQSFLLAAVDPRIKYGN